jgi:flagellar biosynthesis protein FlhG
MLDQASRMRELAQRRSTSAPTGRPVVLTVTSGKGGVGKSSVVLALAYAFAEQGLRVVLLDADTNLAGLDVMCGLSPRFRVSSVLRGEREIESILISPRPGVRLVPGSSGEIDFPLLQPERQQQLLEDLRTLEEPCDILIIDTAAGLTPEVIGFADGADGVIVVTTPEPTAIVDAYAVIKVMTTTRPATDVQVLMNATRDQQDAERALHKLQMAAMHFLKRDVLCVGAVPYDTAVRLAVERQQPLLASAPRSGAALSLKAIAARLTGTMLSASLRKAAAV